MVSADYPLGIDCGFPQEGVEFSGAREAHVEFAAIRIGQGEDPDSDFAESWPFAKQEKILRFAYDVYDPDIKGSVQAEIYSDTMPWQDRGELPPALDLELLPVNWNELKAMVDGIERFDGREAMICYSGAWFLNQIVVPPWLQAKPFWLVGYNDSGPTIPKGFHPEVLCWQQTNAWIVKWVGRKDGRIDRDYWIAGRQDLWRRAMARKVVDATKLFEWITANAEEIEIPPDIPPDQPPEETFHLVYPADLPVKITQLYGRNPAAYMPFGLKGHEGLDLRAANGSRVRAGAKGIVYRVEDNPNSGAYGIHVRIKSEASDGVFSHIYAHFEKTLVKEGDIVEAGQDIGLADNTGNSSGAHLHVTLKLDGADARGASWIEKDDIIDPTPYFSDIFPGNKWHVDVGGNFRAEPKLDGDLIRWIPGGQVITAISHKTEWGDWWEANYFGTNGFFWAVYKLSPL